MKNILNSADFKYVCEVKNLEEARSAVLSQVPTLIITEAWVNSEYALDGLKPELSRIPSVIIADHNREEDFLKSRELARNILLVKPIHEFTLLSAVRLLVQDQASDRQEPEPSIAVRDTKRQLRQLLFKEILWIKAEGNYTTLHTVDDRVYVLKISLVKLLGDLDGRFVRIQKAHAVNIDHVGRVDLSQKRVFIGSATLPIGHEYRQFLVSI